MWCSAYTNSSHQYYLGHIWLSGTYAYSRKSPICGCMHKIDYVRLAELELHYFHHLDGINISSVLFVTRKYLLCGYLLDLLGRRAEMRREHIALLGFWQTAKLKWLNCCWTLPHGHGHTDIQTKSCVIWNIDLDCEFKRMLWLVLFPCVNKIFSCEYVHWSSTWNIPYEHHIEWFRTPIPFC